MLDEFKKFALRGNVVDLAVGVIIGGAFGKIVTSLVNDIIMPVLGVITGNINLTALKWTISEDKEGTEALSINYGQFLQTTLDFLLVAFSIFMVIKLINSVRKKEEEKPKLPEPSKEELILSEIRDILKSQNK
ncbi:MAG: large-conductance mechanosensitive channel protein MscL [Clostridia bacterium]|nr:large-conductance mechanosensitive channel protein MscL [Clostridia bacterium]